jgi:glycosyltransferase involved in cell wall biosynthesis
MPAPDVAPTRPTSAPVAVIVPVRDGAALLGHQLEALAAQDHAGAWDLMVCDNGSTDGTAAVLARWAHRLPQLRVVDASALTGAEAARNRGVAAAPEASMLLFCDADDVVSPGWVRAMVDALDRWPIVTGPVVMVDAAGTPVAHIDRVPRYFGQTPYALGASLGIRRGVFEGLGGFVTAPPGVSVSDVELGVRAAAVGHVIGFAPEAAITKRRRPGLAATSRQWYEFGRGARWISRRHRGAGIGRASVRVQVRTLGWLVLHPDRARTVEGRRRWVCWSSQAAGWLVGTWLDRGVRPDPT